MIIYLFIYLFIYLLFFITINDDLLNLLNYLFYIKKTFLKN